MLTLKRLLFIPLVVLYIISPTQAQWSDDPAVNLIVHDASLDPFGSAYPKVASDGHGGAIVVWYQGRYGCDSLCIVGDLYAQRVDALGYLRWDSLGVPICIVGPRNNVGDAFNIISDGSGGAIICWHYWLDSVSVAFMQRVDSSGNVLWSQNGIPLSDASEEAGFERDLISDGDGGAIVCLRRDRIDGVEFYAQRVDANGTLLWGPTGTPIITGPKDRSYAHVTTDGSGGAIFSWVEYETDGTNTILAQRLNAGGQKQWVDSGVIIFSGNPSDPFPTIISDDSGGAIIAWETYINESLRNSSDIYGQRVSHDGSILWTINGIPLAADTASEYGTSSEGVRMVEDGAGGAILSYNRTLISTTDVFAQRVGPDGTLLWGNFGTPVTNTPEVEEGDPVLVGTTENGAIIAWYDQRNSDQDIYMQKLNSTGSTEWTSGGILACNTTYSGVPYDLVSDGANGSIISFSDRRNPGDNRTSIYAQNVLHDGKLGQTLSGRESESSDDGLPETYKLEQNYPNPFNPMTHLEFRIPASAAGGSNFGLVTLKVFDVLGRKVATLVNEQKAPGRYNVSWNASGMASGVYFYRLQSGSFVDQKKMLLIR